MAVWPMQTLYTSTPCVSMLSAHRGTEAVSVYTQCIRVCVQVSASGTSLYSCLAPCVYTVFVCVCVCVCVEYRYYIVGLVSVSGFQAVVRWGTRLASIFSQLVASTLFTYTSHYTSHHCNHTLPAITQLVAGTEQQTERRADRATDRAGLTTDEFEIKPGSSKNDRRHSSPSRPSSSQSCTDGITSA